jgi:DNA-binding transcriptional MerR regulator
MPRPEPKAAGDGLTIDTLAARVGMTVRNLREWHTLGLIPSAQKIGRVGYYDEKVVARIESIRHLQEQGFTLELIKQMLDASGRSATEVLRMAERLRTPFLHNDPPVVDSAFEERWGPLSAAQWERAIAAGIVRRREDGSFQFTSALAAYVLDALNDLGVPLDMFLEAAAQISSRGREIAAIFEGVWLKQFWEPFIDAGMPEAQLPELQAVLTELRPLALDAVVALFAVAMEQQIEHGIVREVGRAMQGRPD